MNYHGAKIYTVFTVILLILLSFQLTGLTCLHDFQTPFNMGGGPVPGKVISQPMPAGPVSAQALPPFQNSLSHDCPCHYMVTYLSGFVLASAPFTGTLAIPYSSKVDDKLPQSIFRPPLVLT